MKLLLIFLLSFNVGFSQKSVDLYKVKALFFENFPHDVQFVHQEHSQESPLVDTLYYEFHYPEIEIVKNTLIFSYILETKEREEQVPTFEKREWKATLNGIDEFYGFEFTFGNSDRFTPHLYYWNIVNESAEVKYYSLPAEQFYKGSPFTHLKLTSASKRSVWFPSKVKSHRGLENVFKRIIRQYKK